MNIKQTTNKLQKALIQRKGQKMSNDLISRSETEWLLRAYADEVGCKRGEYELANGILKAACFISDDENVPNSYKEDKNTKYKRGETDGGFHKT